MKRSWKIGVGVSLSVLLALFTGAPAGAETIYSFDNITNNSSGDAATGEAQLFVGVDAYMGDVTKAVFRFFNVGPLASAICDIFFDDGRASGDAVLLDFFIINSQGVSFSPGAKPGDLPGGNQASPAFHVTSGLSADSDAPVQPNGVNPGEELKIVFSLQSGKFVSDVISQLDRGVNSPLTPPTLRIGIHAQGFEGGGSESFVSGGGGTPPPSTAVPLPAPAWMGLALMGGLAFQQLSRKWKARAAV